MSEENIRDEAVDERLTPPGEFVAPPAEEPDEEPDVIRVGGELPEEPEDPMTYLSVEEREQFKSLLTIGKRVKKITVLDRPVVIASLMTDDVIRVGTKSKDHRDSQAFAQVYQAATVAAAVRSVDGQSWENTLEMNPDPDVLFEQKYAKVIEMYPLVVQYIYQEVITLDSEFAELATKLGKLKG